MKRVAALMSLLAAVTLTACSESEENISVTGISLSKTTLTLAVGGTKILTATVTPALATNKSVTWASSNAAVASVAEGRVAALQVGSATITATAGDTTATCEVRVSAEGVGGGAYTANGVSFDMVSVAGGTLSMGATDIATPAHSVAVGDFAIGQREVTQGLWEAVMGSYPSTAPSSTYGLGSDYPVYYVSWQAIVGTSDSVAYSINGVDYYRDGFCYKLSQLVGGGTQFCLPTEAEWEYAARGGSQSQGYRYSGSNTVGDVAWYDSNSDSTAQAVGTKAANELGIYDMSGNVWEWCSDWYSSTYYSGSPSDNPTGPVAGVNRVVRGGGWGSVATGCRVAYRHSFAPGFRTHLLGFRLVLP
ncbi:MAG: SUMF1/EgtB/PvdO family nonheme iron enzyme [Prevotellaceae bacterium]|jgi:formylglycine-generating enzyme required for sulfatase activity|nr:SUMF1/EgtB/PvdO family nonheme iron enzyme [Prevotellaceae bacterium]